MTEKRDVETHLKVILSRIRQDQFGGRDAPEVGLVDGTGMDENGVMRGSFEVRIRTRNGDKALLHTQSLDGISDQAGLEDAFATGLSKVLAVHNNWPR